MGGNGTLPLLGWAMAYRFWIFLVALLGGCATVDTGEPANELAYGCKDLVVIGRIATLSGTSIPDADPLPNWRSEWQLQVKIKRVIRGSERRLVVPAVGLSHAQIRDDRDFLAVLRPIEGGAYSLETAALWYDGPRPRLIEPCS